MSPVHAFLLILTWSSLPSLPKEPVFLYSSNSITGAIPPYPCDTSSLEGRCMSLALLVNSLCYLCLHRDMPHIKLGWFLVVKNPDLHRQNKAITRFSVFTMAQKEEKANQTTKITLCRSKMVLLLLSRYSTIPTKKIKISAVNVFSTSFFPLVFPSVFQFQSIRLMKKSPVSDHR